MNRRLRFCDLRIACFNSDADGFFSRGVERQSDEVGKYKRLVRELQKALKEEDYLEAARIRDEALKLREIIISKK